MLGSLILYCKGMRILMFQLSGFYCKGSTRVTRRNCQGNKASGFGGVQSVSDILTSNLKAYNLNP